MCHCMDTPCPHRANLQSRSAVTKDWPGSGDQLLIDSRKFGPVEVGGLLEMFQNCIMGQQLHCGDGHTSLHTY